MNLRHQLARLRQWDAIILYHTDDTTTAGWYWCDQPNLGHTPGGTIVVIPHTRPDLFAFRQTTDTNSLTVTKKHRKGDPEPLNW